MSIIEFPRKNEHLLNHVKNQFYRHHDDMFLQLQQIVLNGQDKTTYTLFFTYAIEQGEYDMLLDTMQSILPNIDEETENIEWDYAYLIALLNTWQLEELESVLNDKWQYYDKNQLDTMYLHNVQTQLDNQLEQLKKEDAEQLAKLKEQINEVDKLTYVQQQNILPQLYRLSDDDVITESHKLLMSKQFHPILKSYVIEQLLNRQMSKDIMMNWFGTEKIVHLDQLTPILESDLLATILEQLSKKEDSEILEQNIILYLSIVYPFERYVFETSEQWIEAVQQKHQGDNSSEWLNKIEKMIQMMTF